MDPPSNTPFKDYFSEAAAEYAAYRPTYPIELVEYLARAAPRAGVAWDCGCGSGQLSILLAGRFERVIATDASAGMISRAVPHPRVEYRNARAESSGLPDAVADLAVAAQAAHWFDLPAYYSEVKRVARPGAVLALVCYGNMVIDADLDSLMGEWYSGVLGRYWPPERQLVEDGYRSLAFPFEELEVPHLEMRATFTVADVLGYMETWSSVRALEKAQGRDRIEAFRREFARAWGSETATRLIRWPLSLRVGRI